MEETKRRHARPVGTMVEINQVEKRTLVDVHVQLMCVSSGRGIDLPEMEVNQL